MINILKNIVSIAIGLILLLCPFVYGENIDPDDVDAQYAWQENTGWFNAEPYAKGDPGILVEDDQLTGYIWAENIGWISLSCKNTDSCATVDYVVTNDGVGNLSGYAWSENTGWINFSCENTSSCGTVDYGVTIDPATGRFSGYAWGENIGWVSFVFKTSSGNRIETSWRGDSDGDGLTDDIENAGCTLVYDADTDNDGIIDGDEDSDHDGSVDINETDPCDLDSDADGIQDGTELGYTLDDIGSDTDNSTFQPDLDNSTTTDPLDDDSDGDGMLDGEEDANQNGRIDPGESDPNTYDTQVPTVSEWGIITMILLLIILGITVIRKQQGHLRF